MNSYRTIATWFVMAVTLAVGTPVQSQGMPLVDVGSLYPATSTSVGADWSSEFGVDYLVRPDGTIIGNGSVGPSPWWGSGSPGFLAPNQSYTAELSRPGFLGGDVSGKITADLGSFGAIEGVVHHYGFDMDLYNPSGCCGVSVGGVLDLRFGFDRTGYSSSAPVNQYWVAEWTVDVVNPGSAYILDFDATFFGQSLLTGSSPATGRYTGILSGSISLPYENTVSCHWPNDCDRAYWGIYGSAGMLGGGMLGAASLNVDIAFAFSGSPMSHLPVAAIPEPETYAMLLAGLGFLGFMARRRKMKLAA